MVENEPWLQEHLLLFDGCDLHEWVDAIEVPATHFGAVPEARVKMDEF